jgi:hypothetical protein
MITDSRGMESRGGLELFGPLPYVYNFWRGARRWRDSAGRIADFLPSGTATQYGVDVVVVGDSTGTFGTIYECWPHHLKVRLQERLNRPGVQGGYGFMPIKTENSSANDWNNAGTWSGPFFHDIANHGVGGLKTEAATSAGANKKWRYFDPTQAGGVFKRQGVTDWQYVGVGGFGAPNYSSIFCDSAASNGALSASNSVANSAGEYGAHWTVQTGLTITTAYTLQIASTTTDKAWASGIIAYGNDYNEGLRLHNLSSVGSATDFWNGNSDILFSNIGQFTTGTNGGSRNCKLLLVNSMLNDCGSGASAALTPTQYKTNLEAIVSYALSRASKPCIGLIVNQPWGYNTSDTLVANAAALARYGQYRDVCYQLADANPDTVFVIDFWKDLTSSGYLEYAPHGGDASVGGSLTERGWYNDGTHLSAAGNAARARMLFAVLTHGV